MNEERAYVAIFTIDYAAYMDALQKGKVFGEARLKNRKFIYKRIFKAINRKLAVNKACQWYWKVLQGEWGQAHQILTVGDHYGEVFYSENFSCSDKRHRYLDEATILLLLKEAGGELVREESTGDRHHPTNSVKRVKRRRKYLTKVADGIYKSPASGTLYYAKTTVPQISENGVIKQKRKRENFKLQSKSIEKALKEIERKFGEPPKI